MDAKLVAGIGGIVVIVAIYLAGLAGCVYIGFLVIQALRKYVGG